MKVRELIAELSALDNHDRAVVIRRQETDDKGEVEDDWLEPVLGVVIDHNGGWVVIDS